MTLPPPTDSCYSAYEPHPYGPQALCTSVSRGVGGAVLYPTESPEIQTLDGVASLTGEVCVVQTAPVREAYVQSLLRLKGFKTFYPTIRQRRLRGKRRVDCYVGYYPSYLFAAIRPDDDRHEIKLTSYVAGIKTIRDDDQADFKDRLASIEKLLKVDDSPDMDQYQPGREVRVLRGRLEGLRGWITERRDKTILQVGALLWGQVATQEVDELDLEFID